MDDMKRRISLRFTVKFHRQMLHRNHCFLFYNSLSFVLNIPQFW